MGGIDCPEAKQPFGTRAKQLTGDLAFGQVVTVKVRDIDRYKRTVAEVILPHGRNLNQEIVRAGLAWWYQQYARRGDGAAGSGLGGAGAEARVVDRSEAGGALGGGGSRQPQLASGKCTFNMAGSF